jgi:hypothetical protein
MALVLSIGVLAGYAAAGRLNPPPRHMLGY